MLLRSEQVSPPVDPSWASILTSLASSSLQLVGTALLVYIKDSLAGDVRKVESTTKKTGLRGMSGNKGGVAIRLDLFDTSLCFVTAVRSRPSCLLTTCTRP